MGIRHLQYVVLTTTILLALCEITDHVITFSESVWDDPVLKNWTTTMDSIEGLGGGFKNTTVIAANGTLISSRNSTSSWRLDSEAPKKSYYFHTLPKSLLVYVLLIPLQQYWNILLERWLPGRPPRRLSPSPPKVKKASMPFDEDNVDFEQQIVDRWIAEGKIQRSSLRIRNTLCKWALDLTVGKIIYQFVFRTLYLILIKHDFSLSFWKIMDSGVFRLVTSFISAGPLISLLGFIVIPARERVVFRAAGDFCIAVFLKVLLQVVAPWWVRTKVMQEYMANATEAAWNEALKVGPAPVRIIDEL